MSTTTPAELSGLILSALAAAREAGRSSGCYVSGTINQAEYLADAARADAAAVALWRAFYDFTGVGSDHCLAPGACPDPETGMPCNVCDLEA